MREIKPKPELKLIQNGINDREMRKWVLHYKGRIKLI